MVPAGERAQTPTDKEALPGPCPDAPVKGRPPAALRPRATRFTHPEGREAAPASQRTPAPSQPRMKTPFVRFLYDLARVA